MIAGLIAAVALLLALYLAWSPSVRTSWQERRTPKPPATIDTLETRLAVHEAGHGIVILRCTLVRSVEQITIEGETPYVSYYLLGEDVPWCALAISLAGMAGEMMTFRSMRSGTSLHDLQKARELAGRILKASHQVPPWPWVTTDRSPDFAAMFSEPLHPDEAMILRLGYAKARAILTEHAGAHGYLAAMLLSHRTVSSETLTRWFGHRGMLMWLGRFTNNPFV